ncbi:MAG: LapA family protein [bacterium]
MKTKHIIIVFISLLVIILILQNLSYTTLKLFFWELKLPITILIIVVLLLGFFIGYLIHSLHSAAVKKKNKQNLT